MKFAEGRDSKEMIIGKATNPEATRLLSCQESCQLWVGGYNMGACVSEEFVTMMDDYVRCM